jgi:hypothetical protein
MRAMNALMRSPVRARKKPGAANEKTRLKSRA